MWWSGFSYLPVHQSTSQSVKILNLNCQFLQSSSQKTSSSTTTCDPSNVLLSNFPTSTSQNVYLYTHHNFTDKSSKTHHKSSSTLQETKEASINRYLIYWLLLESGTPTNIAEPFKNRKPCSFQQSQAFKQKEDFAFHSLSFASNPLQNLLPQQQILRHYKNQNGSLHSSRARIRVYITHPNTDLLARSEDGRICSSGITSDAIKCF